MSGTKPDHDAGASLLTDHATESFLNGLPPGGRGGGAEGVALEQEVGALKRRLAVSAERLESVLHLQGVAREGLDAAHREIQLSNEQLQLTNEMLQVSREIIDSARELLRAVNLEMQHRSEKLTRLNNDLTNLLQHANAAVVLLGPDLTVRHFTPQASRMLGLMTGDLGRSILRLNLRIDRSALDRALVDVTKSQKARQERMKGDGGRWMTVHLTASRAADQRADGVVLTVMESPVAGESDGNGSATPARGRPPKKKAQRVHRMKNRSGGAD